MAELRLVFQPAPDTTVTIRVDFSSADGGMRGGGPPQLFTFQLRPEDYAELRWYLEEFMDLPIGGSVLRANRIEQSLIQWGRDLYKAVFDHGDHRDLIRDLMRADDLVNLLARYQIPLVILEACRSIGQAIESGRGALMVQRDRWLECGPQGESVRLQDWFLPQLYQRGNDIPLVRPATRPEIRQEPAKRRQPVTACVSP